MTNAKRSQNANRGITLISLVITIILLLILATVAISLAVDSDGLFSKAGEAANSWNTSVESERTELENLMIMANSVGGITPPPSSLPAGWNSEAVVDTVEEGDRIAPIPDGFVASKATGENTIAGGLVIYQTNTEVNDANHPTALTTYNQYVWIPVDDINDMVMCQTDSSHTLNETTLQCTECGEETGLAGKLYWDEDEWVFAADATGQTYNANSGLREPAVVTGNGEGTGTSYDGATDAAHGYDSANEFLAHLEDEFENMAKSVAKYGGFYISRYEMGVGGTSFKGQTVLCNDTTANNWYGMYNTIEGINEEGSSTIAQMVWGSQYDQVIKFLDEDEANKPTVAHNDRGLSSEPKASGEIPLDEMSNIFDLDGNYLEWTAEAYDTDARVHRGR